MPKGQKQTRRNVHTRSPATARTKSQVYAARKPSATVQRKVKQQNESLTSEIDSLASGLLFDMKEDKKTSVLSSLSLLLSATTQRNQEGREGNRMDEDYQDGCQMREEQQRQQVAQDLEQTLRDLEKL